MSHEPASPAPADAVSGSDPLIYEALKAKVGSTSSLSPKHEFTPEAGRLLPSIA
jgi:hypothetical protein